MKSGTIAALAMFLAFVVCAINNQKLRSQLEEKRAQLDRMLAVADKQDKNAKDCIAAMHDWETVANKWEALATKAGSR